jgi:hypothetical protein
MGGDDDECSGHEGESPLSNLKKERTRRLADKISERLREGAVRGVGGGGGGGGGGRGGGGWGRADEDCARSCIWLFSCNY